MSEGDQSDNRAAQRMPSAALKLCLETGPLVIFFFANWKFGIFAATAALMVSVLAALVASWSMTGRLPVMPMATAAAVLVFGSLTLIFQDQTFIKMKPTIVDGLFGAALLGALAFGKPLLPVVLDSVFSLTEEGWRILTRRWGFFFFFLAALNEIVWRTQTTSFWVAFKAFGIIPLTLLFALLQTPLILRHEAPKDEATPPPDHF